MFKLKSAETTKNFRRLNLLYNLWLARWSTNQLFSTPVKFNQQKFKQILEDLIETDHLSWSQEMLYSEYQFQ